MSKLIKVSESVKESLDRVKAPGQTYSGCIEMLLERWLKWNAHIHAQNPNLKNGKGF